MLFNIEMWLAIIIVVQLIITPTIALIAFYKGLNVSLAQSGVETEIKPSKAKYKKSKVVEEKPLTDEEKEILNIAEYNGTSKGQRKLGE